MIINQLADCIVNVETEMERCTNEKLADKKKTWL